MICALPSLYGSLNIEHVSFCALVHVAVVAVGVTLDVSLTQGGNTPLYHANETEMVDFLMDKGAEVDKVQYHLKLACDSFIILGGHVTLTTIFTLQGKQSPLFVASHQGKLDTVKLLIKQGANVDRPTNVRLL